MMEAIENRSGSADRTARIVELFLANCNNEATRRVYAREIRLFLDLVRKPLADVELEDLVVFKASLCGLKSATVARKLVILKALLTFAHEERLMARNPARRLKVPRVHQREPQILTVEEAEALLRSPDRRTLQGKRDHAVLALLLATGLRESEACALDVGDVAMKWAHHVLTVRRGKGDKPRAMSLPDPVWDNLEAYLEARGKPEASAPMFLTLGKRGARPSRITPKALDYLVKVHAKRALIAKKVTPHLLRHCACSFALANGASLADVREMAGHSSLAVSNRYLHAMESANGGAARKSPLFGGGR
ncbi:tyrosine-type recombinase/integrase [Elusimicrobiota bacterium]